MSKTFEPHYRVALQSDFGTGLFKGTLELSFSEEVWRKVEPHRDYIFGIYNGLLFELAEIMKKMWKEEVIKKSNGDRMSLERYGLLLGTDMLLAFGLSSILWENVSEIYKQRILQAIDSKHDLILNKYVECKGYDVE